MILSLQKNDKDCVLYKSILPAQPSLLIKLQVPEENGIPKEAKVADDYNIQTDYGDDLQSESDEYVNINTNLAANLEAESHASAAWGAPETGSWRLLSARDYGKPKRRPPVNN